MAIKTRDLICRLVSHHEMPLNDPMLRDEYFADARTLEWEFLVEYFKQFNTLPNKETFIAQFPTFPWVDVKENAQWLADEVAQDYIDLQMQKKIAEIDAMRTANPRQAIAHLQLALDELFPYANNGLCDHGDLWDPAYHLNEIERRRATGQLGGITLGLSELDEVTGGTKIGEIEIYFARPGVGKSFWLLYGALQASKAGYRVAYISPEMDRLETDMRFYSYVAHSSGKDMLSGKIDDEEWAAYKQKVSGLSKRGSPILFYDPIKIGRRFTTADVKQIIKERKVQLVCLDGLMLIDAVKDARELRIRITNTISELKSIAVETGVPIRIAHQANRESEQRSKNPLLDDLLPKLHHMAESGSVEQYANRALAIAKNDGRTYICIRKNRGGPEELALSFLLDADRGRIKNVLTVNLTAEMSRAETSEEKNSKSVLRF